MILRRVIEHVRNQNWTAVALDFVIVVVGVLLAMQISNWNEANAAGRQRGLIVEALINDISDHIEVQNRFIARIDQEIAEWADAYADGARPAPAFFRIDGSDAAPDTWGTLRQMPVAALFDPTTVVMLAYYYSEIDGLSERYIRYVRFVETEVLPNLHEGGEDFYGDNGVIKPRFAANMDRLAEHREELARITAWAECLVGELKREGRLDATCSRASFRLDTPRTEADE
ncbi:MAG: hypothetical protein GC152_12575 [Alphaproteobacteria bacterium]|nr:hypothetical protein [Alphaproteobacteria bacterium]